VAALLVVLLVVGGVPIKVDFEIRFGHRECVPATCAAVGGDGEDGA